MIRQLPVIPTIIVFAAAAVMVWLGVWQLGRADEKAELISAYESALENAEIRPFPATSGGVHSEADFFHPTVFVCAQVLSQSAIAGRNDRGQSGYAQIAECQTAQGAAYIKLGWSAGPEFPRYSGGPVKGLIVRGGPDGARVQLDEPLAGLRPLAKPDPGDLPNNHLAYAGQWFFFAMTALVIYGFAVRSRIAKRD